LNGSYLQLYHRYFCLSAMKAYCYYQLSFLLLLLSVVSFYLNQSHFDFFPMINTFPSQHLHSSFHDFITAFDVSIVTPQRAEFSFVITNRIFFIFIFDWYNFESIKIAVEWLFHICYCTSLARVGDRQAYHEWGLLYAFTFCSFSWLTHLFFPQFIISMFQFLPYPHKLLHLNVFFYNSVNGQLLHPWCISKILWRTFWFETLWTQNDQHFQMPCDGAYKKNGLMIIIFCFKDYNVHIGNEI
jgi:hypothetical protein